MTCTAICFMSIMLTVSMIASGSLWTLAAQRKRSAQVLDARSHRAALLSPLLRLSCFNMLIVARRIRPS